MAGARSDRLTQPTGQTVSIDSGLQGALALHFGHMPEITLREAVQLYAELQIA